MRDKGWRIYRNKLNNAELEFNTDKEYKEMNKYYRKYQKGIYCRDKSLLRKLLFFFRCRETCGFKVDKPQYD